jgi:hypothetical protein
VLDAAIRFWTRSDYSHVEMLDISQSQWKRDVFEAVAASSSWRDGGVRSKTIEFKVAHWDFVGLPWAPVNAMKVVQAEIGAGYDYWGLIMSQILDFRQQQANRWFCSEICAHALGFAAPHKYSPGSLFTKVLDVNGCRRAAS